jgi:hypothetical protein
MLGSAILGVKRITLSTKNGTIFLLKSLIVRHSPWPEPGSQFPVPQFRISRALNSQPSVHKKLRPSLLQTQHKLLAVLTGVVKVMLNPILRGIQWDFTSG